MPDQDASARRSPSCPGAATQPVGDLALQHERRVGERHARGVAARPAGTGSATRRCRAGCRRLAVASRSVASPKSFGRSTSRKSPSTTVTFGERVVAERGGQVAIDFERRCTDRARAASGRVSAPRPGPISMKRLVGLRARSRATTLSTQAGSRKCWPKRLRARTSTHSASRRRASTAPRSPRSLLRSARSSGRSRGSASRRSRRRGRPRRRASRSCGPWKSRMRSGSAVAVVPARARSAACPEYRPSSVSGGSISISREQRRATARPRRRWRCSASRSRNRCGIERERFSDELFERGSFHAVFAFGSEFAAFGCRLRAWPARSRETTALEVVAVVAHGALVAERLRPADAAAVQDERVGRPRPALRRQRAAQLLLDDLRIVRLRRCRCGSRRAARGDRPAGPGTPSAWPSTTFAVLRPTPGSSIERLHVGRHLAAVVARRAPAPCR